MSASVTAVSSGGAFRSLRRSVRLLSVLGGAAMALSGECEPLFLIVFLSLFMLGMQVERSPLLSRVIGRLQPALAGLVFVLGILDFFFLSDSFLLAVAHFLLSLQGVRLLALTTPRENLGGILISSMMMLSASTLSVEWTFFAMLFFFLVAVIWALMVHTVVVESREETGFDAVLPARPLPWMQMIPVVRRSASLALLASVLCCAFVFAVFPRFNFQGFRGQFLQPVHRTGFTNQVDLQTGGRILNDDSVVMRVEVSESERSNWTGYMRGGVLERFDGRAWRNAPERRERLYRNAIGEFPVGIAAGGPERRIRQSIYLESMDSPVLFAAPDPVLIRLDRPFVEISPDGTVRRGHADTWRVHYEVLSYAEPVGTAFKGTRLYNHRDNLNAPLSTLLYLPPNLPERVRELARKESGGGAGLEAAQRLTRYLRTNYDYTLDIQAVTPTDDPISTFLFERRRGHCEYFASALAVLLRARGIPSRLVTGFNSNELNTRGGYYVVRMRHAHTWVEAYLPGDGWVAFDPTPLSPEPALSNTVWSRFARAWDYLNLRWNRYILSYDIQRQVAILRTITTGSRQISFRFENMARSGHRVTDWFRALRQSPGQWSLSPSDVMLASLGFAAFGAAVATGVLVVRRLRRRAGRVWFYPKLLRILERKAGPKPVGQTLREFGGAVPGEPAAAREIQFLTDAYYRHRFGDAVSPEDRAVVRSSLRRLARHLTRPRS